MIESIEQLAARLEHLADDHEWNQFHSPKNFAMGLSVESSELVEIFQ